MSIRLIPLAALLAALTVSGCGGILTGGPRRDVFELRNTGPAMTCARNRAMQVVVETPKAAGPIDTERVLVRPNPLQIQYLPDAQWGDTVPVMVQTLLVQRMSDYPLYAHVGRAPLGSSGDYALLSEIGDFSAVVEGRDAVVTLKLSAQMVKEMSASVVSRQNFAVRVPVQGTGTPALMAGFDQASQQLIEQVSGWAAGSLGGNCRPAG